MKMINTYVLCVTMILICTPIVKLDKFRFICTTENVNIVACYLEHNDIVWTKFKYQDSIKRGWLLENRSFVTKPVTPWAHEIPKIEIASDNKSCIINIDVTENAHFKCGVLSCNHTYGCVKTKDKVFDVQVENDHQLDLVFADDRNKKMFEKMMCNIRKSNRLYITMAICIPIITIIGVVISHVIKTNCNKQEKKTDYAVITETHSEGKIFSDCICLSNEIVCTNKMNNDYLSSILTGPLEMTQSLP